MVAGHSERVESLSNVMTTIKSDGSFKGSDEELHLKAREVIIQRSVDSAIKAAQEKGTYSHIHVHVCVHVHVYCILSCIGCIIDKCPDKNCKPTMLLDKG